MSGNNPIIEQPDSNEFDVAKAVIQHASELAKQFSEIGTDMARERARVTERDDKFALEVQKAASELAEVQIENLKEQHNQAMNNMRARIKIEVASENMRARAKNAALDAEIVSVSNQMDAQKKTFQQNIKSIGHQYEAEYQEKLANEVRMMAEDKIRAVSQAELNATKAVEEARAEAKKMIQVERIESEKKNSMKEARLHSALAEMEMRALKAEKIAGEAEREEEITKHEHVLKIQKMERQHESELREKTREIIALKDESKMLRSSFAASVELAKAEMRVHLIEMISKK